MHTAVRKGTQVPYMAHLLGVASLVMGEVGHVPFAVTEDMVIAGLLHDAVEDEGGLPRLQDIEAKFGKEVADFVKGCTDSFELDSDKKAAVGTEESFLHQAAARGTRIGRNAARVGGGQALQRPCHHEDYGEIGAEVWKRFKRGREQQLCAVSELRRVSAD